MVYEAVVFDNDGVLTHPTPRDVLRDGARAAFRAFDVEPTTGAIEAAANGFDDGVRRACERHGIDAEAFWRRRELHTSDAQRAAILAGTKPLYDDVRDALAALTGGTVAGDEADGLEGDTAADGGITGDAGAGGDGRGEGRDGRGDSDRGSVATGIVSNNQHATVEGIVDLFDLHGYFGTAYGRDASLDGFHRRKPETDYLERALDDLGVDAPGRVLYVGDSTVDVEVAARLGADSAFVRRPHREGYDVGAEPTYEVSGLDEVVDVVRRANGIQ
jgi:phosphoglycolate phosphatase-like HAD superfamily hydrolase